MGEGPTRKLKLAKHSIARDSIEGVGHVQVKHCRVEVEIKGRPKRMNKCLDTSAGGDAKLVGDKVVVEGHTQLDAHSTTNKAVEDHTDLNWPSAASRLSKGELAGRAEETAYRYALMRAEVC